ncbi:Ig-like domain-containing protein, partial [Mycolicibacterium smegmatis]
MVGVAKPIYINFQRPIANKQMAQDAIRITSNPP